jgi:hypothetical protein
MAATVHGFTRDVAALRRLDQLLGETELDHSDTLRVQAEYLAGKHDVRTREELKTSRARWEKRVEGLKNKKGGAATFAVAAATLKRLLMSAAAMGEKVDADRVVRLAEEAHAADPAQATQEGLIKALLFRAHVRLVREQPEYAKMEKAVRRSLDSSYLIAVAVERGGKLRDAVVADKDVRRAAELLKDLAAAFPDEPSPWAYILLQATHPVEAAKVLKALGKEECERLARSIALKLTPVALATALDSYWELKLAGKEAEGKAALKRCAALGVPMPFDVDARPLLEPQP